MAVRCFLGALLVGATSAAPSISSCGNPADIFKHVSMAVSPDPVERGTPFTITVTGDLGTDLTSGTVSWDIDAKVLVFGHSVVDKASKQSSPFTLTPGARAGPSKLVVGPITLPGELPGSADISGKVIVADGTGAQVACVALEFHLVLGQATTAPLPEALGAPQGVTSCGKSGDHMQGVTFGTVGGGDHGLGHLGRGRLGDVVPCGPHVAHWHLSSSYLFERTCVLLARSSEG
mmetsp:Transcript_11692/g.30757  ORF Transcript_11692/g.30757 Transcript_11692/m.30757 type:complete len:233 (-) Transcript_11692:228-926(-)